MIKSMTGYGCSKAEANGFVISVELKSVNNKYLDTSIRLPRGYLFAEEAVKSAVSSRIGRGKVDVFVNIDSTGADDISVNVNMPLVRAYYDAIKSVSSELSLPEGVTAFDICRMPDVLLETKNDVDADAMISAISSVTFAALDDFDKMRIREGSKLENDILQRVSVIEQLLASVEASAPETVNAYRDRLEAKMREVLNQTGIDEARLISEAAIFADHIATDEETVRLHSHIAQFRQMVETGSPIGRKIDFLIQEFNREANTIASKCQNSEIAHTVVDIKSEIEKIREQIQNIE